MLRQLGLLLIVLCCFIGCSTPPKPSVVVLDGNRTLTPGMKSCVPIADAPGHFDCVLDPDRDQVTKGYWSSVVAELGRCGL